METTHTILFQNANDLNNIASNSVDLIVTSPPYPMIEMWDDVFSGQDMNIAAALENENGPDAFELMHKLLDPVWEHTFRLLKPGGFACINIGDATRTLQSNFAIYPNHSRILQSLIQLGFTVLPEIIWRKQTNAPNKFMGSGMLPAGAYVTLEHEYILIARKGSKRQFDTADRKKNRRQSAIFWEERNSFFSDIWFDIKGTFQQLPDKNLRGRSAAFPFELAYRLINMYSVKNDTVFDPFLGTGTTMAAAMTAARNSIGCEIDTCFKESIVRVKGSIVDSSNKQIQERLNQHRLFVRKRQESDKPLMHENIPYGFPVVTAQEKELFLNKLESVVQETDNSLTVVYEKYPGLTP